MLWTSGLISLLCVQAAGFQLLSSTRKPAFNSQDGKHDFRLHDVQNDFPLHVSSNEESVIVDSNRRALLAFTAVLSTITVQGPPAADAEAGSESITMPLKFNGKELLIYYRVEGSLFRAVLDTGSPFLMIPGSSGDNTRSKSGCFRNQGVSSGLAPTYEIFDGFEGEVDWRMAPFSFVNATGSLISPPLIVFGVVSESIMSGPGGVFFGLIRDTESDIRPSFLGQTAVKSFEIDLLSDQKALKLSTSSLIPPTIDYIKMTTILRRRYSDPVTHYTAQAKIVEANGYPLLAANDGRPIYVIIDTGVTGMVVSRELFDERYAAARQRREHNLWGNVTISFKTAQGKLMDISATKPLTTPFDPQVTWKKFHGHLIVLGLAFLDNNRITIDIDDSKLLIER
jgi:hypothetical protein